jgi:hypothetical protein
MRWMKTIVQELFGLFIDDGSFAFAIVAWIGVLWFLGGRVLYSAAWSGAVLFAGLGLILLASTIRRSRQ